MKNAIPCVGEWDAEAARICAAEGPHACTPHSEDPGEGQTCGRAAVIDPFCGQAGD